MSVMRLLICFVVTLFISIKAFCDTVDLFNFFCSGDVWEKSSTSFVMENRGLGFIFADDTRTVAVSTKHDAISFGKDFPIYETKVYWKGGKLSKVDFSIYNKGDAVFPMGEEEFNKLVSDLDTALSSKCGKPYTGPVKKPSPHMFVKQRQWTQGSPLAMLEWAYCEKRKIANERLPFMGEYIRITLAQRTKGGAGNMAAITGTGLLTKQKKLMTLKNDVLKSSKGDVYIDGIPMVDQGQKGYCAAATAERILRHYRIEVDQHQVAQMAQTSAQSGTSFEGIADAVEKIGKQYSLNEKILIKADSGGTSFEDSTTGKDLKEYNKAAKRAKHKTISWEDCSIEIRPGVLSINVNKIWEMMEPEILLTSKLDQKQRYAQFKKDLCAYIDKGVPLMWSCLVGIFPEVPDIGAQGAFGHMRLIIGYNKQTDELLYSDSWGGAHSLKRMPMAQGWAMTKGLLVLLPRN